MKKVKIEKREQYQDKDVYNKILSVPVDNNRGLSIKDMRTAIKILDKVEAAEDYLLLEDVEHLYLQSVMSAFPFGLVHRDLIAISDALESAEEYKVE